MNAQRKKPFFIFLFFYVLIILFVATFFVVYTNSFKNSYIESQTSDSQRALNIKINDKLKGDYSEFVKAVNNNNIDSSLFPFSGNVINNLIEIDNQSVNINNNYFKENNIGFFNDCGFYLFEDSYGALKLDSYFLNAKQSLSSESFLIMDQEGKVYFDSEERNLTLLSDYIDGNTSSYFDIYFSKNESGFIEDSLLSEDVIISFKTLEDFQSMYILQIFSLEAINLSLFQYNMFIGIFLIIFTILVFSALGFVYRSIHIVNADVERRKIKYYYAKPSIIEINHTGKIIKFNDSGKQKIIDHKDYGTVEDFMVEKSNEDSNVMEMIKRQKNILVNFVQASINFIPLKTNKGYLLVGTDSTSSGDVDIHEVQTLAYFDEVTKLANYNRFKKEFNQFIKNAQDKDLSKIGFVGFNIREFRNINKTFSEKIANDVLLQFGQIIAHDITNHKASLYNTYDDIFLVMFKDIANERDLIDFVELINKRLEKPLHIKMNIINIKVVSGLLLLNTISDEKINADVVYEYMLEAINKAKDKAVNNYVLYDKDLKYYISQRKQMEKDLLKAIEKNEFIVYLQPQYDTERKKIIGFEALMRWDNPNYIKKSPQEFISIAEENSLIVEIGRLVRDQTFLAAKQLKDYDVKVSLNISPVQILQQGYIEDFLSEYKKHNFKKGTIVVEITETFLIQSFEEVNEKIKVFKKNGIDVHLDDFGTGYSSLPYLKELLLACY